MAESTQRPPRESNVYQQSVARVLKMGEQIIVLRCLNSKYELQIHASIKN